MDKKLLAGIGIVVLVGLWLLMTPGLPTTDLCFNAPKGFKGSKCIEVEIANNDKSRRIGLSGRDSLREDAGMLFVFDEEGRYDFWMKGMRFPLDIIWINKDKRVVHIARNLPPCQRSSCPTYAPENNSLYVLEVNAKFTEKYNITNETLIFFQLPR
ncbi:MAG TPA: DUF192 domain-containing protein [Candidatus Altiarchaeales archaeon]|nr:DUF192 domain-containing protein [Candidatus Altiarchaeales archaeon]